MSVVRARWHRAARVFVVTSFVAGGLSLGATTSVAAGTQYVISDGASCEAFLTGIGATGAAFFGDCYVYSGTLPAGDTATFKPPVDFRPQYDDSVSGPAFVNKGTIVTEGADVFEGGTYYGAADFVNDGTFTMTGGRFGGAFTNNGTLTLNGAAFLAGVRPFVNNGTVVCGPAGRFTASSPPNLTNNGTLPNNCDGIAPSISGAATKANGFPYAADTWTNQDVTVTWTCADVFSGIASCPVPDSVSTSGDTTLTRGTSDNNANTAGASFRVKIDKIKPTISADVRTADGEPYVLDTWTNQSVIVRHTCTDTGGSGIDETFCPPPSTLPGPGFYSITAYTADLAENFSDAVTTSLVKIDTIAPTISAAAKTSDGQPYTPGTTTAKDVIVTFTCSDPMLSGIATCPDDVVVSSEGTTTVNGSATDAAGNSASTSFVVTILRTPPTVSCGSAPTGWSAANVSIACTASDPNVGIQDPADASFSLTTSVAAGTETNSASTGSRTVFNTAGVSSTAGPITGIKVDRKGPSITVTSPTSTTYLLGQVVTASYACTDGGSGVATCSGTVPSGAPIDTSTAGLKTFTVNATDQVGNPSSTSVAYSVGYRTTAFSSPIAATGVTTATAGSVIPLKWSLADANRAAITSTSAVRSVTYRSVPCPPATGTAGPVITAASSKNSGVTYSNGQFKFEWVTPRTAGCYTVTVTLVSGQTIAATVRLKR